MASTASPAAIATSRGLGPLQAAGPNASGWPATDRPDGGTCAHAYCDGVASASALPGLAGIAGSAGASIADATPARADAMDDGGPGQFLPTADAAAVAVEPGTSAVNLGAIDATTGLEPGSCLRPESHAH